nr:hypothetical protein [Variovorax boronicumulans]
MNDALVRVVFAPPLWPRAVALVCGMLWGVAALCGTALGGPARGLHLFPTACWLPRDQAAPCEPT